MRLAIVCRPWAFHGGVETATAGLMAELVRQGHQVHLYTTRGQRPLAGVSIHRLPVPREPSLLRLWALAWLAARAARRSGADLVQSHERLWSQDLYRAGEGTHRGYLAALGRRARVNPYHRSVRALEERIFSLRGARHVVAISRAGEAEIQRLYGTPAGRVTVVYNGVDLERFHPDNRGRYRRATREALAVGPEEWVVLFVGSGFERKGLGPLIEGLMLADRRARLLVAGKGDPRPYQATAERLGVARQVAWVGAVQEVERLYAAADCVALPALYEPFGNVHLEALAAGLPVLTSSRAGGAEVIRSGDNGWVVAEPTPALIRAGLEALRSRDPAALAGEARRSAEPFTYSRQVESLAALYRALAP